MTILIGSYLELVDGFSPANVSCNIENGKTTFPFYIKNPSADDLVNILTQIFGTTSISIPGGLYDGRLNRQLPLAHPIYPMWYATGINKIKGIGTPTFQNVKIGNIAIPQIPAFALYPIYEIWIDFSPLPYVVTNNEAISINGYAPFGDSSFLINSPTFWYTPENNTPTFYFFAPEWERFTDFDLQGSPDFVSTKYGQYSFYNNAGTGPDEQMCSNLVKLYLGNQIMKFTWYQVPFRFIQSANSYITQAVGRINQNPWYNWDTAQLLYLNYSVKRYTAPVASLETWIPSSVVQTNDKLCNITFDFLVANRTTTDMVSFAGKPINWIPYGHNLQPWYQDRLFHYAASFSAANVSGQGAPAWLSFPFELLFTDPDVPNNTAFV